MLFKVVVKIHYYGIVNQIALQSADDQAREINRASLTAKIMHPLRCCNSFQYSSAKIEYSCDAKVHTHSITQTINKLLALNSQMQSLRLSRHCTLIENEISNGAVLLIASSALSGHPIDLGIQKRSQSSTYSPYHSFFKVNIICAWNWKVYLSRRTCAEIWQ